MITNNMPVYVAVRDLVLIEICGLIEITKEPDSRIISNITVPPSPIGRSPDSNELFDVAQSKHDGPSVMI